MTGCDNRTMLCPIHKVTPVNTCIPVCRYRFSWGRNKAISHRERKKIIGQFITPKSILKELLKEVKCQGKLKPRAETQKPTGNPCHELFEDFEPKIFRIR